MGHPRSVEIAAATAATAGVAAATTFSRGAARLIGFWLASSHRLLRFDRPRRTRTGYRLFIVADAAAGAAGLREPGVGTDCDRKGAKNGNSDRAS